MNNYIVRTSLRSHWIFKRGSPRQSLMEIGHKNISFHEETTHSLLLIKIDTILARHTHTNTIDQSDCKKGKYKWEWNEPSKRKTDVYTKIERTFSFRFYFVFTSHRNILILYFVFLYFVPHQNQAYVVSFHFLILWKCIYSRNVSIR